MSNEIQRTATRRSVVRVVVVVAIAAFVLGSTLPNLFADNVGLPFAVDDHNRVVAVFADHSTIRLGDVVDWQRCDLSQKLAVIGAYYFEPGAMISIPLVRGAHHYIATSRAQPEPTVFWLTLIKRGSATVFVV